jgi:PAS domain-containing protein
MSGRNGSEDPIRGLVDADGCLAEADPELAGLQLRAGGEEGGALALPQVAGLARLARRLGIVISRAVTVADTNSDFDLWIRAEPTARGVELAILSWNERPPRRPADAPEGEREADFLRAAADWTWEVDEALRFTSLSPAAAAAAGKAPADLLGQELTRLFRLHEGEEGTFPILTALAEQRRFDSQVADLRDGSRHCYRLAGVPLLNGTGRFSGFRGSASRILAATEATHPPRLRRQSRRAMPLASA